MYQIAHYHTKIAAIRAYCDKQALSLELIDTVDTDAKTDGKTVFLPMPRPEWTNEQWTRWEFLAFHEAGHNRAPADDLFTLLDKEKLYGSTMMWYLNIIDDFRQERLHTGEYAGRDSAVNQGRAAMTVQILATLREKGVPPPTDQRQMVSGALFTWTDRNRPTFQPAMSGYGDIMYDMLPEEQQKFCDALVPYDSRLCSVHTAKEELELLRDILKDVFKLTPEELSKAEEGMSRKEAEKAKAKARGKAEEGEGEGEGEQGGSESGEGEEGEGEARGRLVRWEDLIPDDHEDFTESFSDMSIDFNGYSYTRGGFSLDPNPRLIVPTPSSGSRHTIRTVGSMANRVRKLLRVKSQKRWVHNQEKGKLSSRSLHHIVEDTEDYRLYKKKTSAITLNSAVTLLVDMSGSMGGEKWRHAINAAYNMYMALDKLRIPTEIIGFQCGSKDRFYLYKTFGERLSDSIVKGRLEATSPGDSNEDAAALTFAADRLMQRREPGKHLIVFSDGSPAGYNTDSMGACISVVRAIESSPIRLIGVGICDKNVTRIYKEHTVIKRAEDLENALMEIIQKRLLK